jgi:hypothetical protein
LTGAGASFGGVLYDGANPATPLITDAGWQYGKTGTGTATVSASGGGTVLDTTGVASPFADDVRAGFNTSAGFPFAGAGLQPILPGVRNTIRFTVVVPDEVHNSDARAGFSVILLNAASSGIELGFWENEIWAQQGPTFGHSAGESAPFDTTGVHTYDLTFDNGSYALAESGNVLLSGALRTYTGNVVYGFQNYLFMGDDTESAFGRSTVYRVEQVVPEPSLMGVFAMVGTAAGLCRRRQ